MRIYTENLTADNTDILAGTNLDNLEAGGQIDFLLISTQADTLISIGGPDAEPIVDGSQIPQETRALRPGEDLAFSLPLATGGHYTVALDIVTAAIVQFMAIYRKLGKDI